MLHKGTRGSNPQKTRFSFKFTIYMMAMGIYAEYADMRIAKKGRRANPNDNPYVSTYHYFL